MLSQPTHCAQNLWARLSAAANQFLRHLLKPARPNLRFWKLKSRKPIRTQPQRLAPDTIALIEPPVAATEAWRVRIGYGGRSGFGASY
jgi:hypothetical protein